jgi:hypothetical protein
MAGRRTRSSGWCEPSAYCRKHDETQLTGSLHCRRFKSVGQLGAREAPRHDSLPELDVGDRSVITLLFQPSNELT